MRRWSLRLGSVFGIELRVHLTFILILVWAAYQWGLLLDEGVSGALYGIIVTLALFICVVLHELGHALTARRFGVQTRDITLLPIGGVASLERMPRTPSQEFWVAIAGPAVNFALTILILPLLMALIGVQMVFGNGFTRELMLSLLSPSLFGFVAYMFLANLLLGIFNLIPAFPMDGGRVLRAVLALRLPYVRATQIAVQVGRVLAVGLGLIGLWRFDIFMILVATFVFTGATQEFEEVQASTYLRTLRASQVVPRESVSLLASDSLSKGLDIALHSVQRHFPVLEHGRVVGVLMHSDVVRGLQGGRSAMNTSVNQLMHTGIPAIQAHDTLDDVRGVMNQSGQRAVFVYDGERYLGLLSADDLNATLPLLQALVNHTQANQPVVPPVPAPSQLG